MQKLDIDFDFRTEAHGKDVDFASPTLKKYHQFLWSKPLPNGDVFALNVVNDSSYLHYKSRKETFHLTSDSISNSYRSSKRMSKVIQELDSEAKRFQNVGNTIGGYIIFPSRSEQKGFSINQQRGVDTRIADRFDLTLECIRLHYLGASNPLEEVLNRNANFFQLFETFNEYVKFFLLDDLVNPNYDSVKFFLPFGEFGKSAYPSDVSEYLRYMKNSNDFTQERNQRIDHWAAGRLLPKD